MDVAGRVAVVTGAAIGTGRAIALALAAAGAEVVAADIDEDGGRQTAARAGGGARFVRADLTVPDDIQRLIDSARPTILVNNAGGGGHIPPHFPDATPDQWGALLDLNLRGPMLATQLALAPMRRAGGGAVVNVASTAGLGSEPYQSPEYGAAKAGLIRFSSALAEVDGVRVNCVVPDWVATERVTAEERATAPPPIPLAVVVDAVLTLIRDETLAGRAMVIWRGEEPRLLRCSSPPGRSSMSIHLRSGLPVHERDRRADPHPDRAVGRGGPRRRPGARPRRPCAGHRHVRRPPALRRRAWDRRLPRNVAGLLRVAATRRLVRDRLARDHRGRGRRVRARAAALRDPRGVGVQSREPPAADARPAQGGGRWVVAHEHHSFPLEST